MPQMTEFSRRNWLAMAGMAGVALAGPGLRGATPSLPEPKSGDFGEPYLDVRKFGARGDGKTDDTNANRYR